MTIGKQSFPLCPVAAAADHARVLIGAYRKADASDPEVYGRSVVAMLASYPEFVVRRVCAPARGIQSRLRWLPALAEIRDACEAELQPARDMAKRDYGRLPPSNLPMLTAEQRAERIQKLRECSASLAALGAGERKLGLG
jgi:hypothetical protein